MQYNVDFEAVGIIILGILYHFLRTQYSRQSETTSAFRKFILAMILAETLDVVTGITISFSAYIPGVVNVALNTVYLGISVIFLLYYAKYVCSQIEQHNKTVKMESICKLLTALYAVILVVNLFTGILFEFSSNGEYVKGPIYLLEFIVPAFFMLYTVVVVLLHRTCFKTSHIHAIMLFMTLSAGGTILQVFVFPNVLLSFFTGTLGAFMCMLTLETPDYVKLISTLEELSNAKSDVDEANRAKTEFLASMSHEIRTPINAVLGYNELIMQQTQESQIISHALNAQSAGRALLSMINDILDYTDIDDGKINIAKDEYPVAALLGDLNIYITYNTDRKNLKCETLFDPNIPQYLIGDSVRITQIVNNLVSNAVKYTNRGTVSLRVYWEPDTEDYGFLCVDVSDTGIGMSREDVERISESFVRLEDTNHRNVQGLGLGMSIVTRLLKLMEGQLRIESEVDKGSVFSIRIGQQVIDPTPLGLPDFDEDFGGSCDFKIYAPEARILFADDNRMNLDLFIGLLRDSGVKIDTAINGEEALELIKANDYDLIFLDHMMPVLDGIETFREINRLGLCPDVPIIVLTANAVAGAREAYLKEGFDAYLSKPVAQKQLIKALLDFLPIEKLQEDLSESSITEKKDNGLIQKFDFLDTVTGMSYCADSEEFYLEMLGSYVENDRKSELDALLNHEEWKEYQVSVHALKSTSLSIGAVELSEEAKALENAVKDEKFEYVHNNHARVMEDYANMVEQISKALTNQPRIESTDKLDEGETNILLVDDDKMNVKVAQKLLGTRYHVEAMNDGRSTIEYLRNNKPDLILLDLHLPDMDGFEVLDQIKLNNQTADIPVIILTADSNHDAEVRGFRAGAFDFITKPFVSEIVLQRVTRLLELSKLQKNLEKEVVRQSAKAEERRIRMEQMSLQTVKTLANAIDAKDAYTNGHSTRVAEYSVLLAKELGWNEEALENLRYAALLHDIGKIGVPDAILNKQGPLSNIEFEIIKSHTTIGGDILSNITIISGANRVARYHHERYDGRGYPEGLRGENIPIEARIVGLADAYDAMNAERVYRGALPKAMILNELSKGRGTQFDPKLADVFVWMLKENKLELVDDEVALEDSEAKIVGASEQIIQSIVETVAQNAGDGIDLLTELPTRKRGQEIISSFMREMPGGFAFVDVDNLKLINDTHGHKAGDRVLQVMGEVLKKHSDNGIACRLGGDEFLIFKKNVSEKAFAELAEVIIKEFMEEKDKDVTISQASISMGICMTRKGADFGDVCSRADKALYYVKQNGKAGYYFFDKAMGTNKVSSEVDLKILVDSIEKSGRYKGALDVEYREFAKLYEYVNNLKLRYDHDFHLVMITVEHDDEDEVFIEDQEKSMYCMQTAIKKAIRGVDICTRYSSVQFLVILLEAGEENVHMIVDRIFKNFHTEYPENNIKPTYAVSRIDTLVSK